MGKNKIIVTIISSYDISSIREFSNISTRPVPWTENLTKSLSKMSEVELHMLIGLSPKIKKYPHKKIKINDITFHFYRTSGRFSPYFHYFYETMKIRKILKKIRPDIVHGQGIESFYGYAAIHSGFPNLITIHGIINEIFKSNNKFSYYITKVLELKALKEAQNVITINPYVNEVLHKYLRQDIKKKFLYPIANPVSIDFFKNKKLDSKGKIINIFYSGVLRPRKGLKDLLTVLKNIKNLNFKLFISGFISNDLESKNYYNEVIKICKNKLDNKWEILGYINPEKMPAILSKMSILVHPSKAETAPMVISEAMASGLPVIAYDVGGVRYMIEDGKSGFVVPLNDKQLLQKRIETLIKDKNLRIKMGKRGREIALEKYHPEIVARQTLAAYKEIIAREG